MKKQNRIHTFALSMMMTGLSVMPVWAFSGTLDLGQQLDTVTCINHTTGEAVAALPSVDGRFDCSALPRSDGDLIGVVLYGMAGVVDPNPNPTPCIITYQESDPGPGFEPVGQLQLGECATIDGAIDIPSDPQDPSTWDIFGLEAGAPTTVRLTLEPVQGNAQWILAVGDGENIVQDCSGLTCEAQVNAGIVDAIVLGSAPASYRLTVEFLQGSGGSFAASRSTPMLSVGEPYNLGIR